MTQDVFENISLAGQYEACIGAQTFADTNRVVMNGEFSFSGVDASADKGECADDQVIMFGRATCKIDALMSAPIQHPLARSVVGLLSIYTGAFSTGEVDDATFEKATRTSVGPTPRGFQEYLGINRPTYQSIAKFGHFSRNAEVDGDSSCKRTGLLYAVKAAV